ncbi:MAG: multiheme c-type cytochrome [Acidobacteriota bacterium]
MPYTNKILAEAGDQENSQSRNSVPAVKKSRTFRRSRGEAVCALAVCLLSLFQIGLPSPPSDSKGYVGAQTCATCHSAQFASQSATGHAQSLSHAHEHPLAAAFVNDALLLERRPNYHFQFSRSSEGLKVNVFDEHQVLEIPVEWAFGAGDQAVTFISRIDKDWYLEHYFSYYSLLGSLAPTPGQEALLANTLPEAAGLMYKTLDPKTGILGCFDCHSTGPVAVTPDGTMRPFESGVRCESCHGPGSEHVEAAAGGRIDDARKLIDNPGRLSADELNYFCGTCHRPPGAEGTAIDWNFPWNVRHQPPYFSQSVCFKQSQGALSCLTCHNPHAPLRQNDAAFYDGRCTVCHAPAEHPSQVAFPMGQPADCVDCHMPRVVPQPPLRFSNHWIGIYASGAKLRPSR